MQLLVQPSTHRQNMGKGNNFYHYGFRLIYAQTLDSRYIHSNIMGNVLYSFKSILPLIAQYNFKIRLSFAMALPKRN